MSKYIKIGAFFGSATVGAGVMLIAVGFAIPNMPLQFRVISWGAGAAFALFYSWLTRRYFKKLKEA